MKYTYFSKKFNSLEWSIGLHLENSCPGNLHSQKRLRHRPRALSLTRHALVCWPILSGSGTRLRSRSREATGMFSTGTWKSPGENQPPLGKSKLSLLAYPGTGKTAGLETEALRAAPLSQAIPRACVWGNRGSSGAKNKDLSVSPLRFPHVFPPLLGEASRGMTGPDRPAAVPALSRPAAGGRAPLQLNGRCRHRNAIPLSGSGGRRARRGPPVPSR